MIKSHLLLKKEVSILDGFMETENTKGVTPDFRIPFLYFTWLKSISSALLIAVIRVFVEIAFVDVCKR